MSSAWRFLWVATRGYRFRPWSSPYLRWRIETYSGLHAESIGFLDFWGFVWQERKRLVLFMGWVDEMKSHTLMRPRSVADVSRSAIEPTGH